MPQNTFSRSVKSVLLALSTLLPLATNAAVSASDDQRATELLNLAREALGGGKLARVHGLSASGTYQREAGDRVINGDLTLDLDLPDKMLRTESMNPMGDATVVMLQGLNGDQVLRNVRMPPGAGNMVVRTQPPGSGPAGSASDGDDPNRLALRNQRAEFARLTMALLLTTPSPIPVDYAYGGEAESADGRADVIDAKGAGSFATRIFLDQRSHRPLMLSYSGVAPRMVMQTVRREEGRGGGRPDARGTGAPLLPMDPPQIVDINLYLDDYREVDGVFLPHHLSRSIDGKPNEEMTFKTVKINPAFRADAFSGR
jgi:hypothetical protein